MIGVIEMYCVRKILQKKDVFYINGALVLFFFAFPVVFLLLFVIVLIMMSPLHPVVVMASEVAAASE